MWEGTAKERSPSAQVHAGQPHKHRVDQTGSETVVPVMVIRPTTIILEKQRALGRPPGRL